MDFVDLFRQPGMQSLCLMTAIPAVLLAVLIWWMWYRRAAPRRARAVSAPREQETSAKASGIWQAIVNFFVEPPRDKGQAAAHTPGDDPDGRDEMAEESTPDTAEHEPEESPHLGAPEFDTWEDEPGDDFLPDEGVLAEAGAAFSTLETVLPEAHGERAPAAPPDAQTSATDQPPADSVEVLRVWRDLADGSLVIDFGKQRYRNLAELADPDFRRRFLSLLHALNEMAGAAGEPPLARPAGQQQSGGLSDAFRATQDETDESPPHMLRRLGRVVTSRRTTPAPTPEPPGIVGQIEGFLQYRIQHSPEYAERSIHIRPSISGVGVSIEVDGHFYENVDDIAEVEVRDFLKATIQEWQNRQ